MTARLKLFHLWVMGAPHRASPTSHRSRVQVSSARRTLVLRAAILLGVVLTVPVEAKDIKLGGGDKAHSLVVELPTIAVAIRADDGGWKHIKIDAWLQSKDVATAKKLEAVKNTIIAKADREFPNHNFETLKSPQTGAQDAKRAIRAAAEASLGQKWDGEVLIHNMLIY